MGSSSSRAAAITPAITTVFDAAGGASTATATATRSSGLLAPPAADTLAYGVPATAASSGRLGRVRLCPSRAGAGAGPRTGLGAPGTAEAAADALPATGMLRRALVASQSQGTGTPDAAGSGPDSSAVVSAWSAADAVSVSSAEAALAATLASLLGEPHASGRQDSFSFSGAAAPHTVF
jgi:hypothetical protein